MRPSNLTIRSNSRPQRPDIVFAYSNAFGKLRNGSEFIPFSEQKIIRPDLMFDTICKAIKEQEKKLTIEKKVLNYESFDKILCRNPRVLIIMCHGRLRTSPSGQE